MERLVELVDVSYTYDGLDKDIEALQDIDLKIDRGEFLCLLGPSGCGKSTLLKILAGYIKPVQGKLLLEGKEIEGADRNRGVVFQQPTLYPWLNVRENIEFGLRMRGVEKQKKSQISERFLEQIRMQDFADTASFELSGGMKQRVALARALANEPEILLMDEPFGALDALTRLQMQKMMRDLWQMNQSTVFMITHDIDEALSLATRIIIMSRAPGRILESFEVDFTWKALEDEKGRVHPDGEYLAIKEKILDLIT